VWIESHQELARHPKTKRLARTLGISLVTAVGHLHFLWWWCLDFAQDGALEAFDAADIADGAGWDGDPAAFMDALIDARFVDRDGDTTRIHDWEHYGEKLLRRREMHAERMRQARAKPVSTPTKARARNVHSTCVSRAPEEDRTGQDQDRTRIPPVVPPSGKAIDAGGAATAADATAPETTGAKPKLKAPKDAAPWDHFEAYCVGVQIDPSDVPRKARERLLGDLKDLVPKYTPDQTRRCAAWLRTDPYWRDKLDTGTAIVRRIAHWVKAGEPEVFTNGRNGVLPTGGRAADGDRHLAVESERRADFDRFGVRLGD